MTALTEPWTDLNPWTDEYLDRELKSMGHLRPYRHRKIKLDMIRIDGVVDCYLRRDFLEWGPFPRLLEGKTVWMSITPQEIESQYMPIYIAKGRVGIGGLG